MTNTAINDIKQETINVKKDIDSIYLKEYHWPDNMRTDDPTEIKEKLDEVLSNAADCFTMHKALVEQCTKN